MAILAPSVISAGLAISSFPTVRPATAIALAATETLAMKMATAIVNTTLLDNVVKNAGKDSIFSRAVKVMESHHKY